jgi:CRP-like cAMP-binding protein
LYRQGEAGDSLAFVVSGALVVTVAPETGGEYELGRVTTGGIVGEMVCIDPAPRSATVTAVQPTLIAELRRDGLTALRSGAPKVYSAVMRAVIRVVGLRLRELDGRIDTELEGSAGERSKGAQAQAPMAESVPVSTGHAAGDLPKKRDGFLGLIDRLLGTS